jgi:uncharacterized delta-60 repeat protein
MQGGISNKIISRTAKRKEVEKYVVGGSFTVTAEEPDNRAFRMNSDGSRDTGFSLGTGFNNDVNTIAIQDDGKILVGGSFTTYDGTTQNRITRLNSDGSRDTGFSIGTGFNGTVLTIAIQDDGKILVGGSFTTYDGTTQNRITRLNSDGSRDTGFSIGTGFSSTVFTIAIQDDGKILVGGQFTSYAGTTQNRITRLNSDGSRDTGFSIGTGFNGVVWTIAIQDDGKILVGGNFTSYDGTTQNRITRLNSDGSRDTGFSIGTGFNNTVRAIAIQDDGKILVGGFFTSYDGTTQNRITRLNSDGSRDTGFSIGTGFNSVVLTIAIQDDGKILVGGSFTTYDGTTQNQITRLNSDGSRDTGFSIGTGFNNDVYTIAIQDDGKILAGGNFTSYDGTTQNLITRLNSDGSRDTGFSIGTGFNNTVNTIAIQSDGKILVGGNFTSYDGTTQNRITRLNSDGSRDTGFSIGTGFSSTVRAIAIQDDGKILVGGDFTTYDGTTQNRITRLNSDGSRDTGFSIGTGFSSTGLTIAIQDDGKILVGGSFTTYDGTTQNRITRLNSDGSRDTGFSIGTGFNSVVFTIAIQDDGKILVGGFFTSYAGTTQNRITRLNSDGSRDTGFSIGTGFSSTVYTIAIQDDGKILAGGDFTSYAGTTQNRITRLNSDGSRDTGFSIGTGFNNTVNTIAIQSDGKILVGGDFTSYAGTTQNLITRLNSDGTYDYYFHVFNLVVIAIAIYK